MANAVAHNIQESVHQYAFLNELTVAQYIDWLKQNVRQYGRSAEFSDGRQSAIELFVFEKTGLEISVSASGEVSLDSHHFLCGWETACYYTYEDSNKFVKSYGKALQYAKLQTERPFIVDWSFAG